MSEPPFHGSHSLVIKPKALLAKTVCSSCCIFAPTLPQCIAWCRISEWGKVGQTLHLGRRADYQRVTKCWLPHGSVSSYLSLALAKHRRIDFRALSAGRMRGTQSLALGILSVTFRNIEHGHLTKHLGSLHQGPRSNRSKLNMPNKRQILSSPLPSPSMIKPLY